MALRAQVEVLRGQIESYEKEVRDVQARLGRQTTASESLSLQLAEERGKTETLGNRVTEVDRLLITQTTEAEILGRRVQELVARLDEQGRFLADRESVSDRLRSETTVAQKTEADLRKELAEAETRQRFATEAIRAEKALLEDQLKQSHEERAKLQREIAGMRRDAESTWESERMENALLRERINDVAAEVARADRHARGTGLGDRDHPGGRGAAPGGARQRHQRRQLPVDRPQRRRIQGHARRPHPRAAGPRLARAAGERGVSADGRRTGEAPASLDSVGACLKSCGLVRALSSAGERSLHTGEVVGSIPTAPTIHLVRIRTFDHPDTPHRAAYRSLAPACPRLLPRLQ